MRFINILNFLKNNGLIFDELSIDVNQLSKVKIEKIKSKQSKKKNKFFYRWFIKFKNKWILFKCVWTLSPFLISFIFL